MNLLLSFLFSILMSGCSSSLRIEKPQTTSTNSTQKLVRNNLNNTPTNTSPDTPNDHSNDNSTDTATPDTLSDTSTDNFDNSTGVSTLLTDSYSGSAQVRVYGSIVTQLTGGPALQDLSRDVSAYFVMGRYSRPENGTRISLFNSQLKPFATGQQFQSFSDVAAITPPQVEDGQIFGSYVPMGYEASFSVQTQSQCSGVPQVQDYQRSYLYSDCNSIGHVHATQQTVFPPFTGESTETRMLPYGGVIFGGTYSLTRVNQRSTARVESIPSLLGNSCTTVIWYFKKCTAVAEYHNEDLKEVPSLTLSRDDVIHHPANPTIELKTQSSAGLNLGVKINVAKAYGGIPVEISLFQQKGNQYRQIVRNGAPTDDGLQLTLPTSQVQGEFYTPHTEVMNVANNQGSGAMDKPALGYIWGMESDLNSPEVKPDFTGWSPQVTQNLKWLPMYSDFAGNNDGYNATSPLIGVRALSLWDSKWEELSISKYSKFPTILKVKFAMRYRKSFKFQSDSSDQVVNPQIWFQHLYYKDAATRLSVVYQKGADTRLMNHPVKPATYCDYETTLQGDSAIPRNIFSSAFDLNYLINQFIPNIPKMDQKYFPSVNCTNPYRDGSYFTSGTQYQLCGKSTQAGFNCERGNPNTKIGKCYCWQDPENRFKRIVFDYKNWGFAMVLVPGEGRSNSNGQNKNWGKDPQSRAFLGKKATMNVSNFSKTGGSLQFVGGAQQILGIPETSFVDDYELYVGSMEDLEKAGLGISGF